MGITLFKKNGEYWTRFKVGINFLNYIPPLILEILGKPIKTSSRFYYWEKKGDFLNGKGLEGDKE